MCFSVFVLLLFPEQISHSRVGSVLNWCVSWIQRLARIAKSSSDWEEGTNNHTPVSLHHCFPLHSFHVVLEEWKRLIPELKHNVKHTNFKIIQAHSSNLLTSKSTGSKPPTWMPWSDENSTCLSAWFYIRKKDVLTEKQDFFQVGPELLYKDMVCTRTSELPKDKGFHLCTHWLKSFTDIHSLWSEISH